MAQPIFVQEFDEDQGRWRWRMIDPQPTVWVRQRSGGLRPASELEAEAERNRLADRRMQVERDQRDREAAERWREFAAAQREQQAYWEKKFRQ